MLRSLLLTSVPRSLPAKSTSENLPCSVVARLLRRRTIWRTAWEREELALAEVCPDVLRRKKTICMLMSFSPWHTHTQYGPCLPACAAQLDHLYDVFCCGHGDLLQAHHLNLLVLILQDTQLGLLVQQVINLNQSTIHQFHWSIYYSTKAILHWTYEAGGYPLTFPL